MIPYITILVTKMFTCPLCIYGDPFKLHVNLCMRGISLFPYAHQLLFGSVKPFWRKVDVTDIQKTALKDTAEKISI